MQTHSGQDQLLAAVVQKLLGHSSEKKTIILSAIVLLLTGD